MKVRLGAIADGANLTAEGKLNVLGEFNFIWSPQLPVSWPLMYVVLKLEADPEDAEQNELAIRILDDDGNIAAPPVDGQVRLGSPFRPGMPRSGVLILGIASAQFHRYGTYEFEILLNGRQLTTLPLHVLPRDEAAGAGP